MASENLDINVNVNTTTAQRNLANLNKSVQGLEDTFGKLKTAISGIAIGNIIANLNNFARSITQAESATGIAISTINGFSNAVGSLGGNAQKAVGDVIDFVAGLNDAKEGSATAQAELNKVGITLQDLATLSNEEIFQKTITGLANMEDSIGRNALAVKLLGKNFKDIDVRQVAGMMGAGGGANIAAIQSAAAAQQALTVNINNLRMALLDAIKPFNDFISNINITKEQFSDLIKIVETLGIVYLFGKIGAAIYGLAKSINSAVFGFLKSVALIAEKGLGAFAMASAVVGNSMAMITSVISKATGPFTLITGIIGIFASTILKLASILLRFLGGPWGLLITGIIMFSDTLAEKFPVVKTFFDYLGTVWNKIKDLTGFGDKGLSVFDKEDADAGKAMAELIKKNEERTQKVTDANRGLQLELNKTLRAYKQQGEEASKAFKLQTEMMGMSEEQQLVVQETANLESQYIAQINAMREKYISMQEAAAKGSDQERIAFEAYSKVHFDGMAQMSAQYTEQQAQLKVNLDQRLKQIAVQKQLIYDAELLTKAYEAQQTVSQTVGDIQINAIDKVRQMQNEYQQSTLPGVYQQLRKIADQENEIAIAAKRRASEQFENDPEGLMQALANIDAATKQAITIQQEAAYAIYQNQRTFEYGWAQAFDSYVSDATNAAKQAGQVFNSITSNMESAIDKFVTTGKLNFGDLARSIIQDLIKIELKAQATAMFKSIGGSGGIFSAITSLFGFANGGNPPINKPSIVGENGPELFVPRTAGTIIPNGGVGAMGAGAVNAPVNNTYITNNINALDAKSVAQVFAENRKTLFGSVELARKEVSYGVR